MTANKKPAAYKFQRRDGFNGRIFWDVSLSDPTNHPYRVGSGLIVPLYESAADAATSCESRASLVLAAFDALEREVSKPLREAKAAIRTAARKSL